MVVYSPFNVLLLKTLYEGYTGKRQEKGLKLTSNIEIMNHFMQTDHTKLNKIVFMNVSCPPPQKKSKQLTDLSLCKQKSVKSLSPLPSIKREEGLYIVGKIIVLNSII